MSLLVASGDLNAVGLRWIDVAAAVAALYLDVFVFVVQLFRCVLALTALAPTQSEPLFAVAQLAVLVVSGRAAPSLCDDSDKVAGGELLGVVHPAAGCDQPAHGAIACSASGIGCCRSATCRTSISPQ